jgi:hypothetical protein
MLVCVDWQALQQGGQQPDLKMDKAQEVLFP